MRILGLAVAGVLAVTLPIPAHAKGPANVGPAPRIVVAWVGRSGGHSGAIGGHPAAVFETEFMVRGSVGDVQWSSDGRKCTAQYV